MTGRRISRHSFLAKSALAAASAAAAPSLLEMGLSPAEAAAPAARSGPNALLTNYEYATLLRAWNEALKLAGKPDPAWRGKTLTVTVIGQGAKGGISGPLYQTAGLWEKRTGARLNVVGVPYADMHEKWLTDITTGTGRYDAMWIPGWFLGDFVVTNSIIPIDKFFNDPRFAKWDRASLTPQIAALLQWNGKWYGIHNDSDGQIFYYRKDVFADGKWRKAFRTAKGYELPDPPRTWQQVLDIAQFFNGKRWTRSGKPGFGITLPLQVGQQVFFHYVALSAPFVVVPGNGGKPDRYHNVYWFDPTDMTPLINTPGAVRALEMADKLRRTGPSNMTEFPLAQGWSYFLNDKALMVWSWGDVGALCEEQPTFSTIKGLMGASGMPGSTEWYDRQRGRFVTSTSHPNVVSNSVGGSWFPVISRLSKHPDLAYDFAALHASTPLNLWNVQNGWTGINPGNKYDFFPRFGTGKLSDWTGANWNANDARQYLRGYEELFFLDKVGQPYLRIPGAQEYFTNLDIHLSEFFTGQTSLKQALDRTARDWDNTTNKLGRDTQLRYYRQSLGMSR